MKKRLLSMLMALVLCLTLLPTAALADELGPVDGTSTVETARKRKPRRRPARKPWPPYRR